MCGRSIPGKQLRSRTRRDSLSVDHKRCVLDSLAGYETKRERKGRIGPSGGIKGRRNRCRAIEELREHRPYVSCCIGSENILRPLLRQPWFEVRVVVGPEASRTRSKGRIHIRQASLFGRSKISAGLRLGQGLKGELAQERAHRARRTGRRGRRGRDRAMDWRL